MTEKGITLYTVGTPNGWKVSIALEELGIPYTVRKISFQAMEQKQEWFLKINPNGRIPAIVDHNRNDFAVFESGAILLYLAEHYDPNHVLMPISSDDRSKAIQWLMWQMGGLGPMQGQANHFYRYAPEKIEYGITRYQNETARLFGVIERALSDGRQYLAGDFYSVADIASFTWVAVHEYAGLTLDKFPLTSSWLKRIGDRPAAQRGTQIPDPSTLIQDGFHMNEEEAKEKASKNAAWVQQSMKPTE